MLIQWAIPCRYAERREGIANLLGAGADTFRPERLPGDLSFWLALRITADPHEFGDRELIAVELVEPDMHVQNLTALELSPQEYPGRDEARQPALIAVLPVSFEIQQAGIHTLHLRLRDRLTTVPLFVLEPLAG